jgi:hypothetical protein
LAGLLPANLFLATVLIVSGLLLLALYRPGSTLVAVNRLAGRALLVTVGLSLVPLLAWRRRPAAAAGAAGRFVLVDRTELEPSTVVALLTLHLAAGMVTGLAALTVVARRANGVRGRVGGPQPPVGSEGPGGGA